MDSYHHHWRGLRDSSTLTQKGHPDQLLSRYSCASDVRDGFAFYARLEQEPSTIYSEPGRERMGALAHQTPLSEEGGDSRDRGHW
jgi:hypothetical protein